MSPHKVLQKNIFVLCVKTNFDALNGYLEFFLFINAKNISFSQNFVYEHRMSKCTREFMF
jgi:hypothetical protein